MLNRSTRTLLGSSRQLADKTTAWTTVARDMLKGFWKTAHHAVMLTGVTAIITLAVLFVKPHLADEIKALSPFSTAVAKEPVAPPQLGNLMTELQQAQTAVPVAALAVEDEPLAAADTDSKVTAEESKLVGTDSQQRRVTAWLSKRYRVATDATDMLVSAAYLTAKEIKIDPLLILSVMAIESRFNPFAESPVGAQGLMQVMSKVHKDKFENHGGIKAALNPVANIKVGSLILKDYVRRGGSVEAGLKLYVGAGLMESDSGYGAKVLAEYQRLKEVASGKKVPAYATAQPQKAAPAPKVEEFKEAESTPVFPVGPTA